MARVRRALGRNGPASESPTPPTVDEALTRLARSDDDLPTMFAERAASVGMDVRPCTAETIKETLASALRDLEVESAVAGIADRELAEATADVLQSAGVATPEWRDDRTMAAAYDADAGITDVRAAIAESGSIVVTSDAARGRGLSLAPPSHIAIVRHRDVVPDMLDYFGELADAAPADLPASQSIITGPSKTADIEGVLVTGVHGPGRVIVILLDETRPA